MAEWLKAHAWKACLGETLTRVRIPLSPPFIFCTARHIGNRTYRRHGLHFLLLRRQEVRDAMEGKFCYGRTDALRDSVAGRGKHGFPVPGVWDLTQDRLQDTGPV